MKVKVKVKVSPCFNSAPRYESVLGSGGRYPRIIDLGIRWRLVVRFAVRPLYRQGKSPWYPLDRILGGPQSCSSRSPQCTSKYLSQRSHTPIHSECRVSAVPKMFWNVSINNITHSGEKLCTVYPKVSRLSR